MAERNTPKPGFIERGAAFFALVSGMSLAVTVGIPFLINLLDAETLEIPTLIAALPAEIPELGVFVTSMEVWHNAKSRRLRLSKEDHAAHPMTRIIHEGLIPLHTAHRARRTKAA